jgi:hypothetical protein
MTLSMSVWRRAAPFVLAECGTFAEREAALSLQTELPMLWCTTRIEDWLTAFGQRRDLLVRRLQEAELPTAPAHASVANALSQIVDLQPALRVHAQAAFLLSAGPDPLDPAIAMRLCRPAEADLPHLAQELVRRHGDEADPPRALGLTVAVPSSADLWMRHDIAYADIIAAPLVAACLALGELDAKTYSAACREAWLYDRDYFESALLRALSRRASQSAPQAAA